MRKTYFRTTRPAIYSTIVCFILFFIFSGSSTSDASYFPLYPETPEIDFSTSSGIMGFIFATEASVNALQNPALFLDATDYPFKCNFLCLGITFCSVLLLSLMILWIKRTKKKYLVLKKQNEELRKQKPEPAIHPKTINGFSVASNNVPFRLRDSIFIKNHEKMVKIPIKDILFIKADRNYCCLHTHKKEYLVVMPLKELGRKLTSKQFLRVHRSFIINLSHIDEIGTGHVVIARNTVPLNKSAKEELLKHLQTI